MENTPRNFALQLGSLITLYTSIGALISLIFGIITVAIPDAADNFYQYESAASSIRFSIAILIVFFPAYLWLTRQVNVIRRTAAGVYLTLTKWLIYLSLLVGGAVLLGDGVALIYGFLNGELTLRFILKAIVLAAIVKTAFMYYLLDARGYWQNHEKQSIQYGVAATLVVIAALIVGFIYSETPAEVREMRIDENQVTDLQNIQWSVEEYYRVEGSLPSSLADVYDGLDTPIAPEGRADYVYQITGGLNYELCAEFAEPSSRDGEFSRVAPLSEKNYNWNHGAGEWCFERVVSPDRMY